MVSAEGACAAYYAYGRHLDAGRRISSGDPEIAQPRRSRFPRIGHVTMPETLRAPEERMNEPFRDKVIRKCGESMEMKEKFFIKYAEPLEAMSREMAQRFRARRQAVRHGKWRQFVRRASHHGRVQPSHHRKTEGHFRSSR